MVDQVHVGDFGTIYELEFQESAVAVDISSFTTLEIHWLKPDGTSQVNNTAVFSVGGVDGKIRYTTLVDTEIDQSGTWKMQGFISKAGEEHHSSIVTFPVVNNI